MTIRLLALFVLFAGSAGAGAGDDARGQLDRFAGGLESLSAEFSQTTLEDNGRVVEESSGQLFYQAPNRFRWDYRDPFPQEMVADGEQLWHYDESLEQVTVRGQPDAADSPLMVLTRPELLDRFYEMRPVDEPGVLEFVPLAEETEFESARLIFMDDMPAALELNDRFGQITRVVLSNLQRNPDLDADLFRFEPPEGVDVLEGY